MQRHAIQILRHLMTMDPPRAVPHPQMDHISLQTRPLQLPQHQIQRLALATILPCLASALPPLFGIPPPFHQLENRRQPPLPLQPHG